MRKIQLKPNGWYPLLPVILPFTAIMMVGASLLDGRPLAETWPINLVVGLLTAVSWWAVASWMARVRLRRQR